MNRWERTYFRKAIASSKIDVEEGIIRDVVMCQVGEAKGHYVSIEQEFIDNLVTLAQQHKIGSKARYGHPTMCSESLGTMLGRFKNVRLRGTQAIGDLHFSEFSAKSPEGNLKEYVLARAEEDPDSFGASIVFTPGESYQRDPETGEKIFKYEMNKDGSIKYDEDGNLIRNQRWVHGRTTYASIKGYQGTDLVDEAAATEGLFSDPKLFASRISAFLDENPDIDRFLNDNPEIESKVAGFLSRRRSLQSSTEMESTEIKSEVSRLQAELNKFQERVKGLFSRKEEQPATDDTNPEASLQLQIEELRTQLSQRDEKITSLQAELDSATQAKADLETQFGEQITKLQAEVTQLGEKVQGDEAPAPAADTPPPVPGSSEDDPFADVHQYAVKRREIRLSFQKETAA